MQVLAAAVPVPEQIRETYLEIRDVSAVPRPLRPSDQDLRIDRGAGLHGLYNRARFGLRIDYRANAVPPLRPQDAAWADGLLRRHGQRK